MATKKPIDQITEFDRLAEVLLTGKSPRTLPKMGLEARRHINHPDLKQRKDSITFIRSQLEAGAQLDNPDSILYKQLCLLASYFMMRSELERISKNTMAKINELPTKTIIKEKSADNVIQLNEHREKERDSTAGLSKDSQKAKELLDAERMRMQLAQLNQDTQDLITQLEKLHHSTQKKLNGIRDQLNKSKSELITQFEKLHDLAQPDPNDSPFNRENIESYLDKEVYKYLPKLQPTEENQEKLDKENPLTKLYPREVLKELDNPGEHAGNELLRINDMLRVHREIQGLMEFMQELLFKENNLINISRQQIIVTVQEINKNADKQKTIFGTDIKLSKEFSKELLPSILSLYAQPTKEATQEEYKEELGNKEASNTPKYTPKE